MPDTLEQRTRKVLELAETLRRTSHPPTTDTEAFMAAAEEHARILASDWPEEVARDWLRVAELHLALAARDRGEGRRMSREELEREIMRLRQGFMPPVRPDTMAANQAVVFPLSTNPNLTTSNYGNGGI